MSRIPRDDFVDRLNTGPGFAVDDLSDSTATTLRDGGVNEATLRRIAGDDGVISGQSELGKLFDEVDQVDHNGSYRSIDTTMRDRDGDVIATESGKLYEALTDELSRARLSDRRSPISSLTNPALPEPATRDAGTARSPATTGDVAATKSTLQRAGFTAIHLAAGTPYFNQAHSPWGNHQYPKNPPERDAQGALVERSLRKAGCAPTALAMADVALRGPGTTPLDTADFAVENRLSGKPGRHGSDTHGLGKAWAKSHDLDYTPARTDDRKRNVDIVRDGLKDGGIAIVSVGVDEGTGKGHFTEKGHVVLINGYARDKDGTEWFFLVNPGRDDQTKAPVLTTDETVIQDRSLHHGAGQLRISRTQLQAEMKNGFVLSPRKTTEAGSQ